MAEEQLENEQKEENGMDSDYIQAIQELKKNSVSKEDYDSLMAENRKLLTALMNGESIEKEEGDSGVPDINELRKAAAKEDQSNLEYITNIMALRKAIMDSGKPDPFIANGHFANPTLEDVKSAERTAECFQHCIEYANGDSEVFTNELMRLTKDVMPRNMGR